METEARWLEISLTVDGELAEAVSEVLSRYTSNGVVTEQGVTYNDAEDEGTPIGPIRVYGFLCVDEQIEETRRSLEESLWHLGQILPLPQASFRYIKDENWMEAWKEHYHPIPIGKRLLILPAWVEKYDESRLAVRIDPSMAFGTGTHPSTQMCMDLAETYTVSGQPVIDVGCGSGILSIAALHLGASHALAVDIDNASVRSTRENGELNQVEDKIETGLGSVTEVVNGNYSLREAPLVFCNILAPIILRLFDAGLAKIVSADGTLLLSGLLAEQSEQVEAGAMANGLKLCDRRQIGDWVALAFRR